jgi:hypothetical protein
MTPIVFSNRQSHKPEQKGRDHCQSPPYAILPLLPYIPKRFVIWEPAKGEGNIVRALESFGYNVISTSLDEGQDFFEYEPRYYNTIVTNPPWSLSAKWTQRCFELGKPFALLLKSDKQQDIGFQKLNQRYGDFEQIHPDCRIDYKMPNKGWESAGAQFNTHWYTFGLGVGRPHVYLSPIKAAKAAFRAEIKRQQIAKNGQMKL